MSSEVDLQLNLTTDVEKPPQKAKRKPSPEREPLPGDEASVPKKKKLKTQNETGQNSKSNDDQPFISSLFNNNPEIPKLELSNEGPKAKEQVFSDKALEEGGVHPFIAQTLKNLGMESLTLVQSLSLPVISAGFDCLIKSQTGSGKTLAYAIPMLQKLASVRPKIERAQGTFALVICPTRELVVQTYEWFQKLVHSFTWLVPGMLIGGEKRKSEKARLRKGITVLIATPGRLIDHLLHTKSLSLKSVEWLVLDECDRMLELGYKRDVETILEKLKEEESPDKKRQTLLLSATLTQGIEEMSAVSMKHPKFIDAVVESTNNDQDNIESLKMLTAPENLQQTFAIIPAKLRLVMLSSFLLWKNRFTEKPRKILVFMATQGK